jgi:hypothetical protein
MYLPETPAATWGAYKEPEPVKAKELRTLPDAVNAIIRVFAPIMIGMGILCLVSGGWCVVSSALVIAQGAIWLEATASHASLAEAMGKNKTLAGVGCCGGPLSNLRGLAIAGIVFACLEILIALGMGIGIGALGILTPLGGTIRVCDPNFNSFCDWVFVPNLASPFFSFGIWLTYAAGASAIGGAFNISICVATTYLLKMLASIASGESNNGAATPNPAFGVNTQGGL